MAESDNAQLRCLEERLLQHTTRRSSERLRELLAEDFVELGSSGRIFNREEIIAALRSEAPGKRELSNFKTKVLADGLVLVTYRSSRTFPTGLEAMALRSSIWKLRGARWQMIFHQGTPVDDS